jgi:hypothetical protein
MKVEYGFLNEINNGYQFEIAGRIFGKQYGSVGEAFLKLGHDGWIMCSRTSDAIGKQQYVFCRKVSMMDRFRSK